MGRGVWGEGFGHHRTPIGGCRIHTPLAVTAVDWLHNLVYKRSPNGPLTRNTSPATPHSVPHKIMVVCDHNLIRHSVRGSGCIIVDHHFIRHSVRGSGCSFFTRHSVLEIVGDVFVDHHATPHSVLEIGWGKSVQILSNPLKS